jgi:hypothetical protein
MTLEWLYCLTGRVANHTVVRVLLPGEHRYVGTHLYGQLICGVEPMFAAWPCGAWPCRQKVFLSDMRQTGCRQAKLSLLTVTQQRCVHIAMHVLCMPSIGCRLDT